MNTLKADIVGLENTGSKMAEWLNQRHNEVSGSDMSTSRLNKLMEAGNIGGNFPWI